MAEGMTSTGLVELRRAVEHFPPAVTAALRLVAKGSAERMQKRAREILRSKTRGTGATADAIEIVEDAPNTQFHVDSHAPAKSPANLVLWLEFGTRHQAARPYMRPAADGELERYRSEMVSASVSVAEQVFK